MNKFDKSIAFIKSKYPEKEFIALHEPIFIGNERKYVMDTLDSTFVSSTGQYVNLSEKMISEILGVKKAVSVVNGTSALQIALQLAGVKRGEEVITQALTFVATANAINYTGAEPIFIDVDRDTMGLSSKAMQNFLEEFGDIRDNGTYNKSTGKRIAACMPMHTFGFPVHLDELINVCSKWGIPLVEDAAESLGSYYKGKATGTFGLVNAISFNGNKIVTSGGGGMIVTNDENLGLLGKHLTTTAKVPHSYEYVHDLVGYNFRMPNINAALLCGQLEQLSLYLENKRRLSSEYADFFIEEGIKLRTELKDTKVNYWLMCLEFENLFDRNLFLKETNNSQIMTRPIWQLMYRLPMYSNCFRDGQRNAEFLEERIVNIPSGVII